MEKKGAKRVSVIVMNPQNGEVMAMVNVPEFNLNDPFTPVSYTHLFLLFSYIYTRIRIQVVQSGAKW